jgi:arylsulfatase A-like enzyme
MRDRGYFTAYMGKWHLAERDRQASLTGDVHARMVVPEERRGGFDFWEGFEGGFLLNNPWLHGTEIPEPVRVEGYQSDVVCGRAARRLPTLPEPWFSVVSLEAPHPPYAAPAGGVAPRDPESLFLRQNVQGTSEAVARARRELSGYYAHGEATDRAVGGLLDALPGDTIIVFTSVHGDMHGSHGLFRKGWPHDESIRVPLLVRYPGAGGVSHRPTSLDELAGFALHWAEPGARGPLPEPAANACRVSMPSVVRLPDQCDRVWTAIREPGRKLVIDGGGKPWLYFDLERDPFEMRNLVDDPTRAAEIRGMLAQA